MDEDDPGEFRSVVRCSTASHWMKLMMMMMMLMMMIMMMMMIVIVIVMVMNGSLHVAYNIAEGVAAQNCIFIIQRCQAQGLKS